MIGFTAPTYFGCKLQPSSWGRNCLRYMQHAKQVVERKW